MAQAVEAAHFSKRMIFLAAQSTKKVQ